MWHLIKKIWSKFLRELNLYRNMLRISEVLKSGNGQVDNSSQKQVVIFNASTRLSGLSQNAGFSLVLGLALQQAGISVTQLVCHRGMSHCVLGTDNNNAQSPPPCLECIQTSSAIFKGTNVVAFTFSKDHQIANAISELSLEQLLNFTYEEVPLGEIILPSLRWILRRHHLEDNKATRFLAEEYILSAWHIFKEFKQLIHSRQIHAVVVFNGMFFPEAVVRWAARRKGIPVYSHEVGMMPLSAFFTDKDATAYPVRVDKDFILSDEQNELLDHYLSQRFKGNFVTAGVQFWPEMNDLDDHLKDLIKSFRYVVPIFTNVIFDTSQGHANVLFEHMFEWLDLVINEITNAQDTLFVIRAHPDEMRSGKESRETVADWVDKNHVSRLSNVVFIPPNQYVSSYDLIRLSKFVMVYNSTIGLEASIMGWPVLCAGKARYTQLPTVFFPESKMDYRSLLQDFLKRDQIPIPSSMVMNARRVLYSQLFRASLPFKNFLEDDGVWKGYVKLKKFHKSQLTPSEDQTIRVLVDGIMNNKPFIIDQ
jgi:hypothetical protein